MTMRPTLAAVLDRLVAEGLTAPDTPARARLALGRTAEAEGAAPWYVRVAAGIGAWVATAFALAFLVNVGVEPDETSALVVGLALVAGAVWLRRRATAEFARQLALAASFAGQALVILRVGDATESVTAAGLAALALSALLVALVPDATHRFLSTLVGAIGALAAVAARRLAWGVNAEPAAWDLALRGGDLVVLALVALAAWAWRGDPRTRGRALAEALQPVGYGLVVALFGILLLDAVSGPSLGFFAGSRVAQGWRLGPATTAGLTAALAALVLAVFRERDVPRDVPHDAAQGEARIAALAGVALLGALTLPTPGVVAAVAVLVLGFDRRDGLLVGVAALFLVAFLGLYYHSLRITLLEKSGVLLASGLLLLVARLYVVRRLAAAGAVAGAAPEGAP